MSKQRKSASKAPAKGKADKLITNAESPAAECSRPMPPRGKGRTGVAQVAGTLGRARQWAAEQADKIKTEAEGAEFPVLCLAAAYTEQAFHLAVRAAQWTRGGEPPIVADFVNLFAALHEYRNRARELLEGQDEGKVWAHWPAAPGTMYCWTADNSALAVAYAFARMIENEIYCNCAVSYNVPSTPCNTPAFSQWRDNAIAGIAEKSLPPLSDWTRWMIHRDTQALLCKLSAEYGQAAKAAAAEKPHAAAQADKPGLDATAAAAEAQAGDGRPFYNPSYFQTWSIGDELLRRNSTDKKKYVEGKVRRQKKKPATGKGKRAVYWYSEPDTRKCWPDKFATVENQSAKA
jgi:hypothetical protein